MARDDRHPPPARRPAVEVLHLADCPHYRAVLALVERVRVELGIDAELHTTLIADQVAAERAGFAGSPTVLVDGRDVEPGTTPRSTVTLACRLYQHEHGLTGQPQERWVRDALLRAVRKP